MTKIKKGLTKIKKITIFIFLGIFYFLNIAYPADSLLRLPLITTTKHEKRMQDMLQFNLYDERLLRAIIADLERVLKGGMSIFNGLSEGRKIEVYNMAVLLDLLNDIRDMGINQEQFSFDPTKKRIIMSSDINTKFSRGYKVEMGSTWSRLTTREYREISKIPDLNFPVNNISFLRNCWGGGNPLSQIAPIFSNSRLVLLDANSENISDALTTFQVKDLNSNTYEIKLSDARLDFGGIPYPDETFDIISMVGRSEFGMSHDDMYRLMAETMRVINHDRGFFLIETTEIDRYIHAIQMLGEKNLSSLDFEIKMYQLSDTVYIIFTEAINIETIPNISQESRSCS